MLKDYKSALNDSKLAIQLDQTFEKGYIRIARCNLFMGDINGAEQIIKKFLELNPNSKALDGEQQSCKNLREIEKVAKVAYDQKNYLTFLSHMDNALKILPDLYKYKLMKAECLVFLERVQVILNILLRHVQILYCCLQEARDIATSVTESDSENADAVYILGLCFYFQGNLDESIKQFVHALVLNPERTSAKLYLIKAKNFKHKKELGNLIFKKQNYRKAYTIYTEALQIDQNNKVINSKLYFNRASASSLLGNNYIAIADCTLALKYNTMYVKALKLRAKCYFVKELFDGCIKDYKALLELEPSGEIENLLKYAQTKQKKSQKKNHYRTLGINRNATGEEIKKAYRKLAFAYHPDRNFNSTVDEKKELENMFKEVGMAYAILSDYSKRADYNKTLNLDPNEIRILFFK